MYIIYIVVNAIHNINRDRYASQKNGGQTMNNNSTGIYLGMDISEKSIELFALPADNKTESKGKIENNPAKIKAFLAGLSDASKLTVALETGTHSPWLSKMLEEHGCKVLVGHANYCIRSNMFLRKYERNKQLLRLAMCWLKIPQC